MERADVSSEEIDSKWEEARNSITTIQEGQFLYRTYIYLLRRRATQTGSIKIHDYAFFFFFCSETVLLCRVEIIVSENV